MGKNERQAYLKAIRSRYRRATRKSKAVILDGFCAVCGYSPQIRYPAPELIPQAAHQTPSRTAVHLCLVQEGVWLARGHLNGQLCSALPCCYPQACI